MHPYTLSSDIYSRIPYPGYNSFKHLVAHPQLLDPREIYYNPLAEARAAESEILAGEATRREEEFLQRRLQELHQSRIAPQSFAYQIDSPHTRGIAYYPPNDHLELLRLQVQEEEQMANLEAMRQRRRELESKSAVERRRREIEELARREKARKLHEIELEIAREAERLRRLGESAAVVAAQVSKPTRLSYPLAQYTINSLRQQRDEAAKVFVKRHSEEPSLSTLSTRPIQQVRVPDVQRSNIPAKFSAPQVPTSPAAFVHFGDILNLLESTNQSKQEKEKPSPSQFRQTAVPQAVPQERFEEHLGNEYAQEVRDTIQALLNSLADRKPAPPSTFQSPNKGSSPPLASVNNFEVPTSQDKGKSKDIHGVAVDFKPSPEDVGGAMTYVKEIESRFYTLENEFTFPDKVDFVVSASSGTSPAHFTNHLAYTANNQPIRFYEHTLNRLLNQLDSVSSFGNEGLRNKRKNVVQKVEHALEELEQEVRGRWTTNVARESKHKVTIEDVTSPEEYLVSPTPVVASQEPDSNTEKILTTESVPALPQPTGEPIPPTPQSEVVDENTTEPETPTEQVPAATEATAGGVPAQGVSQITAETETVEAAADNVDLLAPPFLQEPLREETSEATHLEDSNRESSESIPSSLGSEITVPAPNPVPSYDARPQESRLAESQDDPSATIRAPVPAIQEPPSPISMAPSDLGDGSAVSENEVGGFLLEDGLTEDGTSKHISDTESIASDWSEMDALTH